MRLPFTETGSLWEEQVGGKIRSLMLTLGCLYGIQAENAKGGGS